MNKTKIEWADYTWNPVIGCRHGCKYCYAKRMNDRFKWIKKWDEPIFFPLKLNEIHKIKKSSKIFIGSMCDLFGDWVPAEVINEIISLVRVYPQHTFMFLTKNPRRYLEFEFPENCQLGITMENDTEYMRLTYLRKKNNYKFISCEPLLGDMSRIDFKNNVNLVIVGAMTGPGAIKPKKEWIDSIKHPNIFYKNNIKKYL
jgi:protein gp37